MVWTDSPDHLLYGAVNAATEKGFFRRRIREAVGLTAFFAFYLTVATLDLGWELIPVPLLTFLSLISAFGGGRKRSSPRDGPPIPPRHNGEAAGRPVTTCIRQVIGAY